MEIKLRESNGAFLLRCKCPGAELTPSPTAAREETLAQLEAAQDRAKRLEGELAEAAAASKRKNGSAWRLRQCVPLAWTAHSYGALMQNCRRENQRLKAELAEQKSNLEQEFVGKQELRAAAEAAGGAGALHGERLRRPHPCCVRRAAARACGPLGRAAPAPPHCARATDGDARGQFEL